jgi:hypothetical protein
MKILRVSIDTSVVGGCFDVEFAAWSNGLVEDFRRGHFRHVLCDVVAAQVRSASHGMQPTRKRRRAADA